MNDERHDERRDNRLGGLALIAGAVGFLATMSLHPTGHDLASPGNFEAAALRGEIAHGLALASLPFTFLGGLALARRLDSPGRTSLFALVAYGFALVAVMLAAIASGFVSPNLMRAFADDHGAVSASGHALLDFAWELNQACARVFVVGASLAILLWSLCVVRSRRLAPGLGVYGLVIAALAVLGVVSGHLRLDVHGFGLVAITQAIWAIAAGVSLWRGAPAAAR
jgi:hypothetical protein